MSKLSAEQKNEIRFSLFEKIQNEDTRSRIMSIAFAYSDESGEEDDLEKMIHFLISNQNRVDELYNEFVGYLPSDTVESKTDTKKK